MTRRASESAGQGRHRARPSRLALPAPTKRDDRVAQPQLPGPELVGGFGKSGISPGQLVDPLGRHPQDLRCLGRRDQRRERRPLVLGIEYVLAESLHADHGPCGQPGLGRPALAEEAGDGLLALGLLSPRGQDLGDLVGAEGAQEIQMDISPMTGPELEAMFKEAYESPPEVIAYCVTA